VTGVNELLLLLIPLGIGAALQPAQIIALIVLLQTKRGKENGFAYVGGMTLFQIVLGAIFWFFATKVESSVESDGGQFTLVVGSIMALLGLLLLIHALRRGFSAKGADETANDWLGKVQSLTPLRAALLGIAFLALDPEDWLFGLMAIQAIAAADLSGAASLITYLLYILTVQSLLLILLLTTIAFPQHAHKWLGLLNAWMERHARAIEITVTILLGMFLLYVGLEYLGMY